MIGKRVFDAILLASAAAGLAVGTPCRAQHATAFDIQDGADAFASNCANCHGPDGNLIEGIDLGRGIFRRPLTDEEIVGIIRNGIPNTPMPATPRMSDEQAYRIVAYLRSRAAESHGGSVVGDPARGRALFEGQGQCMDCHRVDGHGSRYGPDLSGIGRLRRADELETALLAPEAEVQPENRSFTVTTARGETVAGRLLNQDTFTVQLIDRNERLRSFEKAQLRDYGFSATTMPSYAGELDNQAVADLVSFLVSLQGQSSQ